MENTYNKKREVSSPSFFYSYLITDPFEYGDTPLALEKSLEKSFLKYKIDIVCFRDKSSKDIEPLAKKTLEISNKHLIKKILINGNIDLALKLGFNGVHLTSSQFKEIKKAKDLKLFTMISTHTEDEINLAKNLGADGVTYSPIFYKKDKGDPKGCEELKRIVQKYQDKDFFIIALGGIISDEQINQIKKTDAKGFASIRYFKT